MKERPILFSGPMVRPILDGEKSVTRRIIKPQPVGPVVYIETPEGFSAWRDMAGDGYDHNGDLMTFICPYGRPGDRLWVREAFTEWYFDSETNTQFYWYRADYHDGDYPDGWDHGTWNKESKDRWKPSLFMPRAASRILLEITSVCAEQLQSITEADAEAEGVTRLFEHLPKEEYDNWNARRMSFSGCPDVGPQAEQPFCNYLWHGNIGNGISAKQSDAWSYQGSAYTSARDSFSSLWESINGPGSWDANPWVWRIEFKTIETNWQNKREK